MDVNLKDGNRRNCLLLTCLYNSNINIIKYLIEDINMNINFENKK